MSTTVKRNGDFQDVEPGTYQAYCYAVMDVGNQRDTYEGRTKVRPQVIMSFEFPTELMEIDGEKKPMSLSAFYTASLGDRAVLRKHLEDWRGRAFTDHELDGFELKNVLGAKCTAIVGKNGKGRSVIKGLGKAIKDAPMPPMANKPLFFDLDLHRVDGPEYHALPEWVRSKINERVVDAGKPEHDELNPPPEVFDDDVPF